MEIKNLHSIRRSVYSITRIIVITMLSLLHVESWAQTQDYNSGIVFEQGGIDVAGRDASRTDSVRIELMADNEDITDSQPLKILLVGNSFSANLAGLGSRGPWGYLGNALYSVGIDADITVAMSPGASLNDYWNHINGAPMRNPLQIYRWTYRNNGQSSCEVEEDVTLDYILSKRNYDIVVQQQASTYAASYSTYTHYGDVRDYIANKLGGTPFFLWQVVWNRVDGVAANPTQYSEIVTATRKLIDDNGLQPSQIIPSGEVVDLAESQGMDLHKSDGVHLNGDGSWMIGLAFSQMILDVYGEGKSIDDCTYLPENIQYQKEAKQIAHQALANVYDRFFKKDVVDNIHSTHTARSHEDVFYNLQGQRINKPSKGIYIVNGQKKIYR